MLRSTHSRPAQGSAAFFDSSITRHLHDPPHTMCPNTAIHRPFGLPHHPQRPAANMRRMSMLQTMASDTDGLELSLGLLATGGDSGAGGEVRIMLVEDEPVNLAILEDLLAAAGYTIVTAGERAELVEHEIQLYMGR